MEQEDLIEKDLTLSVLLPEGHEKTVTVHGSKPMMDVLVILCAQYHLNPSDHVIELFSTNHNKLKFKPSSLIGSLEAELVMLKPKQSDVKKAPNMPVATVRLLINYRKSHKAVVRVSPRVPLAELMPAVCEKCELDPKSTVLLRDSQSEEPLDLTKTLNDYGIRDVYAKAVSGSPNDSAPVTQKDCKKDKRARQEKVYGEKENRRLLSLFRRSQKSSEETPTNADAISISTAASLVLKDQHAINTCCSEANSASEMPKKRRAPQPPSMLGSQSASAEPNCGQQISPPSTDNKQQGVLGRMSSTESSLKRNKRRAPPPPSTSPSLSDPADKESSSFLENAEEDNPAEAASDQSGDFKPARSSVRRSPLMTEVVSELTERIKSMEQKDTSPNWSVAHSPPASNLPPESIPVVDGDPAVPPGCEVLRRGSQRDGINTFTVVPRRRTQSPRRYEFLLTMENSETVNGDTGGRMEGRILESRQTEKMEMSRKETVMLEKTDDEFENVVETNNELGIAEVFEKLHLNIDTQEHPAEEHPVEENLEEERPAEERPAEEHPAEEHPAEEHPAEEHPAEEHPAEERPAEERPAEEHPHEEQLAEENLEEKRPAEERPAEENLEEECPIEEHPHEEQLAEEYLAKKNLPEEHLTEEHLTEDRGRMEDQDERDWIEEFRKRRRRFLRDDDDRKGVKLKTSRKGFDEEMLNASQPPKLPVCWEEEESETQNLEKTGSVGKVEDAIQNPVPFRYEPPRDPTSEEPYWNVNLSSNSETPFTSSSQSSPQNLQPNSLPSASLRDSTSRHDPSFELSSPNSPSLFALMVSQKAQNLGNVVNPLVPSTRTISSPPPHPQRVSSQQTSSQKLYFQSLISQEFISKISASRSQCNEAPPTSSAPPTVVMSNRERKRDWNSFSETQLKDLKRV